MLSTALKKSMPRLVSGITHIYLHDRQEQKYVVIRLATQDISKNTKQKSKRLKIATTINPFTILSAFNTHKTLNIV